LASGHWSLSTALTGCLPNVRGVDVVMMRKLVAELSTRLAERPSIEPGEEDRAGVE
jgi:hypothetical protein